MRVSLPGVRQSSRALAAAVLVAVGLVGVALGGALAVVTWAMDDSASDARVSPTTPGLDPSAGPSDRRPSPPAEEPGASDFTVYAHPPIARGTTPSQYVQALRERSDWADGLFLYYPLHLEFGARPEIEALQTAYPDGVPLTVSAKNADPVGLAAFRDQLTPQQAALTLWERWQEPADNFTTPAERAAFRADVLSDIEILRPAGIRVGVHEQCWTLDPANSQPWAGEQALLELIPPEVDIVTVTCLGGPADLDGQPKMARMLDFLAEHYPGVDVGFTSLAWSVPAGTPADSPLRAERAEAARAAVEFAAAAGVTEFGWFDFDSWEGRDYDVGSDPALLDVLVELSARSVRE